jgi:23S rRNA pseudouridine2605 synthase
VVVRTLGTRVDPARDEVRVDGTRVRAAAEPVHLVLFKPRGVVTTRSDPARRPTVMDLVPKVTGLFPVGRLDVNTEGLLLLTNDGAFAERVAHPRFEVPRVYHAKVRGVPDAAALERLRRGVKVEGEELSVDRVRVIEAANNSWVEVTLHEGRHHEVRRLLDAVGHPVSKLRRVSIGPVTTHGLAAGEFRALTPREVALLSGRGRSERSMARPAGPRAGSPRRPARPSRAGGTPARRPR